MKVLFITRTYPPIIGGMEKVSYEITTRISKFVKSYIIANKKGKKNLPLFLPYALFKSLYLIKRKNIDAVHLSDAMLSPIGIIIKYLTGVKVITTVHALDVTYKNPIYQFIVPKCLKRLDRIIAVSNYTIGECVKRGVPEEKCVFIPNGVNPKEFILKEKNIRKKLEKGINVNLKNKKILLSVGHLVKRKGFNWFIENIMPRLDQNFVYLIIGGFGNESKGNELETYLTLIKKLNLQQRVFLLGKTSNRILKLSYNSADLFVMPNIKVEGDAEGFGIVAIEAGSCGLPVIASNMEGIKDAVINGKTGWLVKSGDAKGFIEKIKLKPLKKDKVMEEVKKNFEWDKIVERYLEVLK